MIADISPTWSCACSSLLLRSAKFVICVSSLPNARITRTPVRSSLVASVILSSFCCVRLYNGAVSFITPNTIINSTTIAATNSNAIFALIVNAMIIAPNTMNGLLMKRRNVIFSPFCTWFTSLVIRVISVAAPVWSNSVRLRLWILSNSSCRNPADVPVAALAAKYCAVKLQVSPSSAITSSNPKCVSI